MTNDCKPSSTPKLRFPEFREAAGWDAEPMGEVYSFKGNNSLSRDKLNYVSGSVKNIHYGDIHTKFSTHFDITREAVPFINESELWAIREENFCIEGDMIFADASEDLEDIGKCIEISRLNNEPLVSGLHTILATRTGDRIVPGFGGHLFKSSSVRGQIQRESQGAKVLGISAARMRNILLPLPHTKTEQQKIADCLTSVDELVSAQARKVDALKTHKKGLMQQLFPRPERTENGVKIPAETQPCLRFPEFHDVGKWELLCVSQFTKVTTGSKDTQNKVDDGRYPFFVRSQTVERIGSYSYDGEAILTSGDGVGVGKNYHYIKGKFDFHQRVYCLYDFDERVSGRFFYHYFSEHFGERVLRMSAKNSVDSVRMAMITEMPVLLPSLPEQQRIADCLTTLDDLITAQTQKLDSLKTHKKGLMQQMFPSMEEIEA
jgi:type I restriction enzyme S subunit